LGSSSNSFSKRLSPYSLPDRRGIHISCIHSYPFSEKDSNIRIYISLRCGWISRSLCFILFKSLKSPPPSGFGRSLGSKAISFNPTLRLPQVYHFPNVDLSQGPLEQQEVCFPLQSPPPFHPGFFFFFLENRMIGFF